MSEHDEYEFEPVRGLPQNLPEGERILWQGSPAWLPFARHVFHIGLVAIYFAALAIWPPAAAYSDGSDVTAALLISSRVIAVGALGIAVLCLIAWLVQRTTVYTITDRRIVMRFGIALPITVNLPFGQVGTAGLKLFGDGAGDIAITTVARGKLNYFHYWPHVRPLRVGRAEPALRTVPNGAGVAQTLANALASAAAQTAVKIEAGAEENVRPATDNYGTSPAAA